MKAIASILFIVALIACFIAFERGVVINGQIDTINSLEQKEATLMSKNDSLMLQVNARAALNEKLQKNFDSLIKINRSIRYANHEKIQYIRSANAGEQLRIYTKRTSSN